MPELTPLETVRKIVSGRIVPIDGVEVLPLSNIAKLLGRTAAQTLNAPQNLPLTDNAAVDGYAVKCSTLQADPQRWFPIKATVRAGHPFSGQIGADEAAAVYTGGVMPSGVDCVFMHEDCLVQDGRVQIQIAGRIGLNIRPAGENLHQGEICLSAGDRLTPQDIGQLAAAGFDTVPVKRPLRITLLSTGDEVANQHQSAEGEAQIADANGPMLQALLAADGHSADAAQIIPDKRDALSQAFSDALESSDVLITSGGASDGLEDHTQAAMADNGIDSVFWRIAMKPGRPMAVGQKNGKLVICLPGNPVAVFVCYRLLVSGWLDEMLGATARPPLKVEVQAGFQHKKRADRAEFLRVRLECNEAGIPHMQLNGRKGAGVISSLQGADGLVEIPIGVTEVAIGDRLPFLAFQERGL